MPASAPTPLIGVCADPADNVELLRAAARVAVDLNLPFLPQPVTRGYVLLLVVTADRLELRSLECSTREAGGRAVAADLLTVDTTSPAGRSLKQPIVKAVGIKSGKELRAHPPTIIDATAGWGEDGWLLAALGCHVMLVERNKAAATLLRDAVLRAGVERPEVLARLTVLQTDAQHLLRRMSQLHDPAVAAELPAGMQPFLQPDVVYLDPMFPGAASRKTAERKALRILRQLVGEDADASALLPWALRVARKRVVVKRPLKAPPLDARARPSGA